MIVAEKLRHKINRLIRDKVLVVRRDELLPGLLGMPTKNAIEVRIEFEVVGVKVVEELFGSQNFGNLNQLVVVVVTVEEGFLAKDHARKHASETPHVQRVVVLLQIDQEFGPFEVSGGYPHVVFTPRVVELCQTPINEAQLALLVVDHDIMWFDITVHDTVGMAIVQSLEQLEDIETNIEVRESRVKDLEVCVVDMLEDERGSLGLRIAYHVEQLDDVCSPAHVLQDLNFSFDLLLFDGLEDFDDTLGVVDGVDALEDLRVLAAADLSNYFVLFLVTPVHREGLIVPILSGTVDVHVGVDTATCEWRFGYFSRKQGRRAAER